MNNNTLITEFNSNDEVRLVPLSKQQLLAIENCLEHCNEQVLMSANDVIVLDHTLFDNINQPALLNELHTTVSFATCNFDKLDKVDNTTASLTTLSTEVYEHELREINSLIDMLNCERYILAVLQSKLNKCAPSVETVIESINSELTSLKARKHTIYELQCEDARADVASVYRSIVSEVNRRTDLVDRSLATDDIYNDTLFSISIGDKSLDIAMYADVYSSTLEMLEDLYEVYDGDRAELTSMLD